MHFHTDDIGVTRGDFRGDLGQNTALVSDFHLDVGGKAAVNLLFPGNIQPFVRMIPEFRNVRTGLVMHDNAAARRDKSQNGIAGDGQAALGKVDYHPLGPAYAQRRIIFSCSLSRRYRFLRQLPCNQGGNPVAQPYFLQ